ncbi:zinc finger protein 569-like [Ischnura elegans]|uniref:zinc finger protein 569-like n=1 Tax=Ischnura elegans TaxID=197161 RepID=UPI001ED8B682|nr:zinc finger protein 569-like [Ischnura elegans]
MPIQTTSISYLLAEENVRNHSVEECVGPTALVTRINSKTGAPEVGIGRNLIGKDLDTFQALDTDKKTYGSIPDGRQCSPKYNESLIGSECGEAMTIDREKFCDAPNTTDYLRYIRISGNYRSGCETVMGDNEENLDCLIKNPRDNYGSNENSHHCSNCRDGFKNKNERIKHTEIYFAARNFDAVAESSIGDVCHDTLPPSGKISSCDPTTSKTLYGLEGEKQGQGQKGNGLFKETSGGKGDEKSTRRVTGSFTVGEESAPRRSSPTSSCIGYQRNDGSARRKEGPCSSIACTTSFAHSRHLTKHKRMHGGEKPYSCSICCKSFTDRHNLDGHVRSHTGEKPYSCGECEKSFSRKSVLVRHVRTHSGEKPYSCTFCSKSFTQSSILDSHVRVHTGEKPYMCKVCSKCFPRKNGLVSHMRLHSGEKPFSCGICKKSFTEGSNLKKHMRKHAG